MIGSVLPYAFAALPVALGMTVGWVSGSKSKTQYDALKKPVWNPPPAVFAPVWTVLYVLMGVASIPVFKLWQQGAPGAGTALGPCKQASSAMQRRYSTPASTAA
ncbi:MAG: hypothetical protein RL334_776 [Chloroflexota bacterium]